MKIVLCVLFCMFCRQLPAQQKVEAAVTNFRNDKGLCRACIFSSARSFEQSKPLQCQAVSVSQKKATVVFEGIPDGTYAVFVFHDANSNGKMDTNFLGIPSEGYGASQNKLPFAARPRFEANKFVVEGVTKKLGIRLRNL